MERVADTVRTEAILGRQNPKLLSGDGTPLQVLDVQAGPRTESALGEMKSGTNTQLLVVLSALLS